MSEVGPYQLAHSSLLAFAVLNWNAYEPANHHALIARQLHGIDVGTSSRLMIAMPPRHGKSMLCSEFFPAWYLGRNPEHSVIHVTYGQELANTFGRKVRDLVASPVFKQVFPGVGVKRGGKAANRVSLSKGGEYYAVGVGGSITGRGANLLIIDDPIKNREEADSESHRRKIKNWYSEVAYTRLMNPGAVVIIQTRWHEDDLMGWLDREHIREGWDRLILPAIDGNGRALWPSRYPVDRLHGIRASIGERAWNALYQQRPTPPEGAIFNPEMFHVMAEPPDPATLVIWAAVDVALKTTPDADRSSIVVMGRDPENRLVVLECLAGRWDMHGLEEQIFSMVRKYPQMIQLGIEKTTASWHFVESFKEAIQLSGTWIPFVELSPQGRAKNMRIERFILGAAQRGMLHFACNPDDFMSEALVFPVGQHDDVLDAMAYAIEMSADMIRADSESVVFDLYEDDGGVYRHRRPEPRLRRLHAW